VPLLVLLRVPLLQLRPLCWGLGGVAPDCWCLLPILLLQVAAPRVCCCLVGCVAPAGGPQRSLLKPLKVLLKAGNCTTPWRHAAEGAARPHGRAPGPLKGCPCSGRARQSLAGTKRCRHVLRSAH
jgi:hypothetical protein